MELLDFTRELLFFPWDWYFSGEHTLASMTHSKSRLMTNQQDGWLVCWPHISASWLGTLLTLWEEDSCPARENTLTLESVSKTSGKKKESGDFSWAGSSSQCRAWVWPQSFIYTIGWWRTTIKLSTDINTYYFCLIWEHRVLLTINFTVTQKISASIY